MEAMSSVPMISYAQNFEDVMLWRALKHVRDGFYVDIGAGDPTHDSVTKAFYERGWHGINVEPDKGYFAKLKAARTRDVNLNIACGRRQTLAAVLDEYANKEIHFLKIDTDGDELDVIKWSEVERHRPWVIVVEAMAPGGQIETHQEWEPLLLARNYHFVYLDGLNRFYIANEYAQLDKSFAAPPNVFDDFISVQFTDGLSLHVQQMTEKITKMERSTSWRITAPLRFVAWNLGWMQ
jgi:hypothetical protein